MLKVEELTKVWGSGFRDYKVHGFGFRAGMPPKQIFRQLIGYPSPANFKGGADNQNPPL